MAAGPAPATGRRRGLLGHLPRILLALLPLALVISHVSGGPGWRGIDRLDDLLQDTRLRLMLPRTQDARIVIVDLDDRSLAELGEWPWPRARLARLLDELFDRQQVAQVGFGLPLDGAQDRDDTLVRALRQRPVVLGYHFMPGTPPRQIGVLPAPALAAGGLQDRGADLLQWQGYRANPPRLAAAAPSAGFLDPRTDADGRVRSVPLLAAHAGQVYEAFALAMYRTALGRPAIEPVFPPPRFPARYHGLSALQLREGEGSVSVPVGDGAAARVPFRGLAGPGGGSFRYVSAADVLAGRLPAGDLQDKLVLVGATATGLGARHLTPVGADYPAIELHASLLSGLLDARLPMRPDYAAGYGLLVLLASGLLLAAALPWLNAWRALGLLAGVVTAILVLNGWLAMAAGLTLPLAPALLVAFGTFAVSRGHALVLERRAQGRLARLAQASVPAPLVRQLTDDTGPDPLQAASRLMTVMFCDIRGFARLSEELAPATVQDLLQRVFSRFTEVIERHGGTVDKYIGDCVMAFWGAPGEQPDHASRAVAAALDMAQAVHVLNVSHRALGLPGIEVGIGLNSGLLCVGDMGSSGRHAYTVVGDAVNLAARLERLSATYGVTVVAGEATRREADDFTWQELDKVCVRGRVRAETVHTPWPAHADAEQVVADGLRAWPAFLKAYRAQDVPSCERLLDALGPAVVPAALRALYAQRVAAMRGRPFDPGWDGAARIDAV